MNSVIIAAAVSFVVYKIVLSKGEVDDIPRNINIPQAVSIRDSNTDLDGRNIAYRPSVDVISGKYELIVKNQKEAGERASLPGLITLMPIIHHKPEGPIYASM